MIDIVRDYCDKHGITISTHPDLERSKTKCIAFNCDVPIVKIDLYGVPLPWVESWKHLGHIVHKDQNFSADTMLKRGEFIGKIHSLQQELGSVEPKVFLILTNIYLSSFYGSNLWDFNSESAVKLYSSWNRMIQTAYNLPFGTHRFILKELSERPPLQVILHKRFERFCEQIKNSGRPEVLHLFKKQCFDSRSIFGRNYRSVIIFKNDLPQYNIPEHQKGNMNLIKELIDISENKAGIENLSAEELRCILIDVCTK